MTLALMSSALAQTPVARLVGDVRDPSGAAVPAASVEVRNLETGEVRRASTDERGGYTIPNLMPGRYETEVDAAGFRRTRQTGLELQVDQTARLDFKLEVGAVTESLEVTAQAPLLNTENAVKGDVIVNQEIINMPLEGRDFFELGLLVPGVAEKREGSWQGSAMAVNGARPDNTNFVVDGFNNQNQRGGQAQVRPPIEAMQEFKVETSGYAAEFGRLAGGVVNMALKTGANRFHGSLFEFLRNDRFDARNFFGAETSKLRRHQFGATLSGPVRVPRFYNGLNRTFFVVSWESLREQEGALNLMRVPTDLERAGNFSQTLDVNGKVIALKDPLSSAACNAPGGAGCFPGNVIPASRFHPAAEKLRNYYPSPNLAGQTNNYRASAVRDSRWDSFLYKIDHRLTQSDALSFRFTNRWDDNRSPFDGSELGTFGGHSTPGTMLGGVSYTRTFTPTVINELRAGFSRETERSVTTYLGRNIASELGIPGTTSDPNLVGFPAFKIRDLPSIGDAVQPPHHLAVNTIEAADAVTWIRSGHSIKFGASVLRGQVLQIFNKNVRGTFNFQGRWTNAPFGDFLLGMLNTATRAVAPTPIYIFNTDVGSFFQDDFRVRPNLTLNLGLRYEYSAPLHEKYDRIAGFVPEIGKLVLADDRAVPGLAGKIRAAGLDGRVALAREVGLPQSLAYANRRNFAPRFGVAWRPRGNSNSSVRGGYGIFYAASANDPIRLDLGNVFPFAATETYSRDARQPNLLTLSNPFPEAIAKLSGVNDIFGQQLRPAPQYLQCWNLTVERQLTGATALEIGYAGSKGTHLGRQININTPDRKPALQRADGSFPRPFEQFNNIRLYMFESNSTYNAGLLTLRRRFANNFFYRISYTFAKSLDYASQVSGQDRGGGGNLDPRNRQLDRGRSNWDTRHNFTTTFSYRTPSRLGGFLGGWQAAGTGRMASGRPFTPSASNAQQDLGEGDRPDRIAFGTLPNPTPERWFDISAFPIVPLNSFRFGNSGRNILEGPGMVVFNLALMKNFRTGELGSLQFRLEGFNATNHPNLRLPDRNVNTVTAAVIDAAAPARVFQAGLRFEF
ncbi:MAG: carboxypeptidase regulatory-like domain-containing protein [Bryobacteraceae bacterium]